MLKINDKFYTIDYAGNIRFHRVRAISPSGLIAANTRHSYGRSDRTLWEYSYAEPEVREALKATRRRSINTAYADFKTAWSDMLVQMVARIEWDKKHAPSSVEIMQKNLAAAKVLREDQVLPGLNEPEYRANENAKREAYKAAQDAKHAELIAVRHTSLLSTLDESGQTVDADFSAELLTLLTESGGSGNSWWTDEMIVRLIETAQRAVRMGEVKQPA